MNTVAAKNQSAGRTVLNVVTNWGAVLFGMAISFVLSPFLVHHLGDARYGLWGVIGSLIGYLGLLDLGIRVGVTRFVARHEATGDREAASRLVSTALGLFGVVELVRNRETLQPMAPFNGSSPEMAALGRFFREEGLYTFVRWNYFFTNPPLSITEAELREGFAIIDRGLAMMDSYLT